MTGAGTSSVRAGLGSHGTATVPSVLSARLVARGDAERAFRLARRRFLAGERIDMGRLAGELGVDRTSLFRWVGNRDALLAEVLWSLAVPTLDHVDATATGAGADRVLEVLSRFVTALIENVAFRGFLDREPARALRLLTTRASPVHRRLVASIETMLTEETERGRMHPVLPTHDLASVLVRIAESFAYADLIAGETPDAARAEAAFALVLQPTRTGGALQVG